MQVFTPEMATIIANVTNVENKDIGIVIANFKKTGGSIRTSQYSQIELITEVYFVILFLFMFFCFCFIIGLFLVLYYYLIVLNVFFIMF